MIGPPGSIHARSKKAASIAAALMIALASGCHMKQPTGTWGMRASGVSPPAQPLSRLPASESGSDGALEIWSGRVDFIARDGSQVRIPASTIWFVEVKHSVLSSAATLYLYSVTDRWVFGLETGQDATTIAGHIRQQAGLGRGWMQPPKLRLQKVESRSSGCEALGYLDVYEEGIQFTASRSVHVSIPYGVMSSVEPREGLLWQDRLYIEAGGKVFRFDLPRSNDITAVAEDIRKRAKL